MLTIGDLARATGTTVETIQYYGRIGLLPRPGRTGANYRRYGTEDRARLGFVRRARDLGFSVDAIRNLLTPADRRDQPCAVIDGIACEHLAEVESKLQDLARLRDELTNLLGQCRAGTIAECRIVETLASPA